MYFPEGTPVTVNYPEGPRDGIVVSSRACPDLTEGGRLRQKYTILFDDDESADPAVHESLVELRRQTVLI